MQLRRHQKEMQDICRGIKSGSGIKKIPVDAGPGAGKTFMAIIAMNELIGSVVDHAVVVTPRTSLKNQFERDSLDELVFNGNILRAADNNPDLLRGCQAYSTTFQAISADPELHYRENIGTKYLLIIDEMQHLLDNAEWCETLKPLIYNATVVIQMTGTLDVQHGFIYGIEYEDGVPVKRDTADTKWITYSRSRALEDGAILPVQFFLFDSSGSYEKDGSVTEFNEIGYDKAALMTAINSQAAESIIDKSVSHWQRYCSEIGDYSQILFVDANIKNARRTCEYLKRLGFDAGIATSDDDDCSVVIESFCSGKTKIMCTVATSYEGLNAPACTHVVSLTHIRSKSWIAQMIGRCQRNYGNKKKGYVFGVNDCYMQEIVRDIQAECMRPTKPKVSEDTRKPNPFGESAPKVNPLYSKLESYRNISDHITISMTERYLRKEIDDAIKIYLENKSKTTINGDPVIIKTANMKRMSFIWRAVRLEVNSGRNNEGKLVTKHVEEMSIYELEKALEIIERLP